MLSQIRVASIFSRISSQAVRRAPCRRGLVSSTYTFIFLPSLYRNHAGNPTVIADAIGLREAINNIIDNGVKFSPSNKPVEVILQETKNPNWVEISVTDHGIGIADRDKPVLFRRFSRIHNAKTNDLPGNGLGLYIANNIIMNHQGEIKVDSKPEVGSTFTIQLPVEYSPN